MSNYIETYKEIKQLMKKMVKKGFFQKYTTKDFFYLLDEKNRGVLVFSEHLYHDGFGIQLFLNDNGLNYLHDILSTDANYPINYFYSDCNLLGLIPRKDLMPDDIEFLKKNNIRILEDNNLIPIKFKEGYGKTIMSKSELALTLSFLYYVYALITNEKEDLDTAILNDLTPFGVFSNTEMSYSCHYSGLPNLEKMPKNKKANKEIIEVIVKMILFLLDKVFTSHVYFVSLFFNQVIIPIIDAGIY